MAEFKHLVLVKFKENAVVDHIFKGMEKLASEIQAIKSFVWGQDIESEEMLRQGYTHAFLMTFGSKDDFTAFLSHPNHLEFSSTFSTVIQNAIVFDFPAVTVKPLPLPPTPTPSPPPPPPPPPPPSPSPSPPPPVVSTLQSVDDVKDEIPPP